MIVAIMTTALSGTAWAAENDTHDMSVTFSQLLNNNATISPVSIPAQSYPIKTVTINWRYNKSTANVVTIEVKVGGTSWGTQSVGTNTTANAVFEGDATTGAVEITFTNNAGSGNGKGTFYVNSVTLTEGASATPAYTINAQSNNNDYGTVSLSGSVITATPATGYTYADPAYTVSPTNSATVAQNGDKFTVTPTDNTTVTINFKAIPKHTVTFSVNGATTSEDVEEGAAIDFPADPANIESKVFCGWVDEAIDGTTDEEPEFVTSATMGQSDVTYYAVFADLTPGTSSTVNDVLTRATTGVTGTSYSTWSGKTATSNAVYAGNSAGGNSSIQLRATSPSGIVSTVSGGKVKKVTVDWNSNTSSGRELGVYVSSKAFESSSSLYSLSSDDKMLGRITYGTSTEFVITGDYAYVGLRSEGNTSYLDNVTITWETGTPDTYSDYCTTVVVSNVAKPVITVAANPFLFSTTATITRETDDATIYYSYDGETWTEYTEALTITETKTIYAKATKDSDESKVASVTATKNLAEPVVTIADSGITNKNLFVGTAAGSLSASVTYEDAPVAGAVVTWSGDNDEVATINATTGVVTLVGEGTVTFTATFAENDDYSEQTATYVLNVTNIDPDAYFTWVETDLASLTSSDVFVIVGNNSKNYAMTNDKGTGAAPAATEVTVVGKTLSGPIDDNLQWNISGDAENGYVFYPNENSETWLYCTNSNNGVRVGTNDDKTFTISDEGYLLHSATSRYVGIYNSQDWRCYTSINSNIEGQTFKFYKKIDAKSVTVSLAGYATYCSDKALDFEGTGITAYYGTAEGSKLTFKPITKVPANTGVLLVCNGGKTVDVPVLSGDADDVTGNILVGVTEAKTLDAKDYILNVVGGKAGFFWAGTHTSLAANRAYIPAAVGAGVRGFVLDLEDSADGIEETLSDSLLKGENIYNLAGQRLSKMQKGINIVNGKKILK